ncbi:MAG TPA: hypothetical protein VIK63_06710 [Haloplasmataceae bacterium]
MGFQQILIVFGLLVGLFIFTALAVYFNRKTPMPENCYYLGCDHCGDEGCHYHPGNTNELKEELLREVAQFKGKEGGSHE